MKIYVEVEGGVVQSVFSDKKIDDVEIIVVDYDNIKAGDEMPELPENQYVLLW